MNEPGGYEWLQGVGSSSGAFHWWGQRCYASIGYLILDLLSHCFLLVVTCWELEQAHNSSVMLIRGAETSQGDSITQVSLWCCHLGYESLLEIFKIAYSINSHIFLRLRDAGVLSMFFFLKEWCLSDMSYYTLFIADPFITQETICLFIGSTYGIHHPPL